MEEAYQTLVQAVFRHPLPNHAGQLIEAAGLKGYKLGGAQVSELVSCQFYY